MLFKHRGRQQKSFHKQSTKSREYKSQKMNRDFSFNSSNTIWELYHNKYIDHLYAVKKPNQMLYSFHPNRKLQHSRRHLRRYWRTHDSKQSFSLEFILNELYCLLHPNQGRTWKAHQGWIQMETVRYPTVIFKKLKKIRKRLPKNEYYHQILHINNQNEEIFFLFQRHKSNNSFYAYLNRANEVIHAGTLNNLLTQLNNSHFDTIDTMQYIVNNFNGHNTVYGKSHKLMLPESAVYTAKHISQRMNYQKIIELTPKQSLLLIYGYTSNTTPDCIKELIYKFYWNVDDDEIGRRLSNGNIIIENLSASTWKHKIIFSKFLFTFNKIYVLKIRILKCCQRSYRNCINLGIVGKMNYPYLFSMSAYVKKGDIIEMVVNFQHKKLELYKNDKFYKKISLIKYHNKEKIFIDNDYYAGLYQPCINMYTSSEIEIFA